METWRLGRRPGLDGLRGVAVLLVVGSHAVRDSFALAGAIGVSVFFVLSGFLITTLLTEHREETGSLGLGGFYLRRARRLLPALFAFLAVMVALGAVIGSWLATPRMTIAPLLYFQNFAVQRGDDVGSLLHLWSLSIEEQFYLVWPTLLAAALWAGGRRAALAFAVVVLAGSAFARLFLLADGTSIYRIYLGSDTNACLLLAGCALALVVQRRRFQVPVAAFWGAVGSVIALGLVPNTRVTMTVVPLMVAALAALAILSAVSDEPPTTPPWLNLVGRRSYALYLWQQPLVAVIPLHLDVSHWVSIPLGIAAAWGVTLLSWRYVEAPMMKRREPEPVVTPVRD